MSYNASSSSSSGGGMEEVLGEMALKIALLLVIGTIVPALFIGLVGYHQRARWLRHARRDWCIMIVLSLVCLYIGYHFFWPLLGPRSPLTILTTDVSRGLHHHFQFDGWRLVRELLPVWAMSLLLGPAAICGVALYEETRPKSPRQLALQQAQQKHATTQQANKAAARFLARSKVPEAVAMRNESSLVLGAPVEGGLLDWIKQRWFCLPLEHLIRHVVVVG